MLFKRSGQKTASTRRLYWLLAISLAAFPAPAWSHSFGTLYTLPVPFWLYAWGSAAALLLSFLLVAWFASDQRAAQDSPQPVREKTCLSYLPSRFSLYE